MLGGQWASDAGTLRQELIFGQLFAFNFDFDSKTRQSLPRDAQQFLVDAAKLRQGPSGMFGRLRAFLLGGWSRRRHARGMQSLIRAVTLSGPDAEEAIKQGMDELAFSDALLGTVDAKMSDWSQLLARLPRDRSLLDLLRAASAVDQFRRHAGRLPTTLRDAGFVPLDPLRPPRWRAGDCEVDAVVMLSEPVLRRLPVCSRKGDEQLR
jgi:hypothetical protein